MRPLVTAASSEGTLNREGDTMIDRSAPGGAELGVLSRLAAAGSRRQFLKWGGATAAVAAVAACSGDAGRLVGPPGLVTGTGGTVNADGSVSLGTGDLGILNYAYALEQLEAAFYTMVTASFYVGATDEEMHILEDLRKHEVVHREFFKAALGSAAIPSISVDFSAVDFTDRASVLGEASYFEDLGVSAYNGAGQLLTTPDYLVVAGKIVSVEARHAAAIRDLLDPRTAYFSGDDVVDENGLDVARMPADVLPLVAPFITTVVDASGLPTT